MNSLHKCFAEFENPAGRRRELEELVELEQLEGGDARAGGAGGAGKAVRRSWKKAGWARRAGNSYEQEELDPMPEL